MFWKPVWIGACANRGNLATAGWENFMTMGYLGSTTACRYHPATNLFTAGIPTHHRKLPCFGIRRFWNGRRVSCESCGEVNKQSVRMKLVQLFNVLVFI